MFDASRVLKKTVVCLTLAAFMCGPLSFPNLQPRAEGSVTVSGSDITQKDTNITAGNDPADTNNGCTSARVFSSNMIANICWECVLPIVFMAAVLGGSKSNMPSDAPGIGSHAMCFCKPDSSAASGSKLGFLGKRISLWEPYRLIEFERQPGCSSVLGGIRFPFDKLNYGAGKEQLQGKAEDFGQITKKHYHYYSYPLMTMLSMWMPQSCNVGMFMDLDVMYMSEIDPTWNYDEIAFFTHPEAALIASPFGAIACVPDAFSAQIKKPINQLYWCAGSWGVTFPAAGHTTYLNDMWSSTSLMSVRVLYQLHRRAVEWGTVGSGAMCGGEIRQFLPKTQYRFSVFHPVAETSGNHTIGQHILMWSIGRQIPVTGEDPVYVVWRWVDCCRPLLGG